MKYLDKVNNLEPITRNYQRTDRETYGTTKHIVKMKGMQRIEERLQYNLEGELTDLHIEFSDETSRRPSKKDPNEIITYRDEIRMDWHKPYRFSDKAEDEPNPVRVGWSTGWQDDLEGKMKEAEIRQRALKYFAKRKVQLLGEA